MKDLFALFMLITLISFLGFVVENLWLFVTKGYMDNRNMTLPFLLGYGLAVAAIFLLFGTPSNMRFAALELGIENRALSIILYYFTVMVCVSLGEIVLGTAVEKICGIVWWDYSSIPMHITKYTSIPTSAGFSLMIVHFMENVFMPLLDFFKSSPTVPLVLCSSLFMIIMSADFVRSAYLMYRNKALLCIWRKELSESKLYKALHK